MKPINHISALLVVAAGLFAACSRHEADEPPVPQPDMIELSDGDTIMDFTARGGTWQIDFTASREWTATKVVSLFAGWYYFTPKQGEAGTGKVTISVFPNTTDEPRSAQIRIAAGKAEQIVTITQEAGNIELTPEEEIRAYLERLYHDTDGENWRFNANWCSDKPISEWDGVRYENGLLSLWLGEKYLKGQIDLSGCTALVELRCAKNSLTKIDVTGCPLLKEFDCTNNEITELNVSGCSSLDRLLCGYNQLTHLDLSSVPSLTYLRCDYNWISAIDISACPWIATLNVAGNGLSALNVVGRTELRSLFCYENRLTQLDLSGCEWLDLVNCGTNRLTELNVTGCSRLSDLYCYDNRLERLDLKPLIAILGGLYCPGNRLTELDLKDFRQLTQLDCSDNALQRIDLTGCSTLQVFACPRNELQALDLTTCEMLSQLDCTSNRLTELDLTNAPSLWKLYCRDNPILAEIPEAFDRLQVFEHDARYEYRTETDPTTGEERTIATDTGRGWWYPGEPEKGAHMR